MQRLMIKYFKKDVCASIFVHFALIIISRTDSMRYLAPEVRIQIKAPYFRTLNDVFRHATFNKTAAQLKRSVFFSEYACRRMEIAT